MFQRKHNQVGEYTAVPAGVGGTANYPAGRGYEAGRDVDMKSSGYGNAGMVPPQQTGHGYSGDYVQHGHHQHHQHHQYDQQTPVSYGPAGQPVQMYPKKKSNRAANWCAAAFVACWACTWPCHGPCCCGV